MSKKFIVKTPFGIGVATSEEDLKELLESIGFGGAEQEESDAPCDCPRCQARAAAQGGEFPEELSKQMGAVAEKLLREKGPRLSFGQYVNRFISELSDEMNATGEDAGDERSESQQGSPIGDILSMIFGGGESQQESTDVPTKESIMSMSDYDEVDQMQISLESEMNSLSDKKQEIVDEIHAEMKRVEDLHAIAASRKAELLENKAASAHIHIADKVKALQEAITESAPHLLIHEDIAEAMDILKQRYRK